MSTCNVGDCINPTGVTGSARGMCRAHYKRWHKYGDPTEHRREHSWDGHQCAERGCEKRVRRNGVCDNHSHVIERDLGLKNTRISSQQIVRLVNQERQMGRPRPERCEICNQPGYGRLPSIVFDHCHATGKPRGWLCDRCNKILGLVKDSPALLYDMSCYLECHNGEIDIHRAA